MKRNFTKQSGVILIAAVVVVVAIKYLDSNVPEKNTRGAVASPRLHVTRERGFREKLVTDANGNLVSLASFQANLKLDDTFTKDTKDFQMKLLVNYIELALLANPQQALRYLRENTALWARDPLSTPTIFKAIASTLGINATREFLDIVPSREILSNIVTALSQNVKEADTLALVDFFLGYDSTLLANEAVMSNIMMKAEGNITSLTNLFLKLPKCEERSYAARVLAEKAHSLSTDEFGKFYKEITQHLSSAEIREMHSKFVESIDSLNDPKLLFLLADGYRGSEDKLLAIANKSADLNLDDALKTLKSLDAKDRDRNTLFSGIMRSWAQYAPKKAAQYAFHSYQSGEVGSQGVAVVYGEWIGRDTTAATSYYNSLNLDTQVKRKIDLDNFPNVASFSMNDGLAVLQQRDNDSEYPSFATDHMRRDFALSDGAFHSSNVVLNEVNKIQDPDIKKSSFHRFSAGMAGENLFKAVSLAAQSTQPLQRDQLLLGTLAAATRYDLNYAHELIGHISNPSERDNGYMQWYDIARKTEPHLAAEWLRGLENSNPQLYENIQK